MPDHTILFGQDRYLSPEPVFFEASDLVVPKTINKQDIT